MLLDSHCGLSFLPPGLMKMSNTTPHNASTAPVANAQDTTNVAPLAPRPRRRKTGGRRAGTPNKATQLRRSMLSVALGSGQDPQTFFADILRNEKNPFELRFAAAKELMPYMHPKLASIEARTGGRTHEDRLAEYMALLSDAEGPKAGPQGQEGGALEKGEGGGGGRGPLRKNTRLQIFDYFAARPF